MSEVVSVERTSDMEVVRSIMVDRAVWRHISDDGSGTPSDFRPPDDDRVYYLLARAGASISGVFMLHPHNTVCYEVHTCMLPTSWGKYTKAAANAGCGWMFSRTCCQRIITNVPTYNRVASKFAVDCGMTEYGLNRKSILKNGTLHDQRLFGIGKEEWQCRQQSH